jgi:ribokinase
VIGHIEWTHLVAVERVPPIGAIVESSSWMQLAAGGGCVAAVQLAKLTGKCDFFTAVGDDELGTRAVSQMEKQGVTVHTGRRNGATRKALVLTDAGGERTIIVHGQRHFPRGDDRLPWHLLESADCALFTAGDDAAFHAARHADVMVVVARGLPRSLGLKVDAVVGSGSDPGEAFGRDLLTNVGLQVTTHGRQGGMFRVADGSTGTFRAPQLDEPVKDSYGAGDAFAAGLTFALGEGRDVEQALDIAAKCGTAVLLGHGPYESQLTRESLDRNAADS